jgi:hypothetical protein
MANSTHPHARFNFPQLSAPLPWRGVALGAMLLHFGQTVSAQVTAPGVPSRPLVQAVGSGSTLNPTRQLTLTPIQQEAFEKMPDVDTLYNDGKHEQAGTLGLRLIQGGAKPSNDVRLKIANSLAWTGRLKESYPQYELLLGTDLDAQARLALANSERWRDRADKALPMYNQILALDPSNVGAREGIEYGSRDLRPSTTISFGDIKDSGGVGRRYLTVAHRWRDETNTKIFEIETRGLRDRLDPQGLRVNEGDVTFRFQPLDVPMQPKAYVTLQGTPHANVYGGVRLKLGDGPTHVYMDRLSWGPFALSPRSTEAGLSAYHLGADTTHNHALGSFYGRADAYRVSDSNTVVTSQLRFTPSWRPLGPGIKAFVSTDTRDVKFNTANYWSPAKGSGTLGAGIIGEWSDKDWLLVGSGQLGRPIYGEAGNSWSASAGGKRWLGKDYAVGVNLWGMSSWRDGANYRARSMVVNLEKLW